MPITAAKTSNATKLRLRRIAAGSGGGDAAAALLSAISDQDLRMPVLTHAPQRSSGAT